MSQSEIGEINVHGTFILILGVTGLILVWWLGCFGLVLGLVAWSMGSTALKKLDEIEIYDGREVYDNSDIAERHKARIGRNCGVVTSLIYLGQLILISMAQQR